jgi:hypothetical protein
MASSDGHENAQAAPVKRSLFKKKSAWSRPAAAETEAVDFFSRSKEVFSDFIAEDKKVRLEKLEKRRSKDGEEHASPVKQDVKRRRVSGEAEDGNDLESSDEDDPPYRAVKEDHM